MAKRRIASTPAPISPTATSSPSTFIEIPMDADRVCNAISNIGYRPASAIMDIIDNSVTAGAKHIVVSLTTNPERSIGNRNNVLSYTIFDDGNGMTDAEVLNAVALGSNARYSQNSLSKYGLGLKAAGLSLGDTISVLSRKDGSTSKLHSVDRTLIRTQGAYGVAVEDATTALEQELTSFLGTKTSGTMIRISSCTNTHQDSAHSTCEILREKLGVTYYRFLEATENPLKITVKVSGKPDYSVIPHDILFSNKALPHFDPDDYDGKRPCLAYKSNIAIIDGEPEPATLEVVLFPHAKMNQNPSFTTEERKAITSYAVSRKNKGFFIYRNNRLIRWGDDLDGIVGKDDIGFRARLVINTAHDTALQVDVSKQRLAIPEEIRNKIELCVRNPMRTFNDMVTKCKEILDQNGPTEGQSFNERNTLLSDEDLDEPTEPSAKEIIKARRATIRKETRTVLEREPPLPPTTTTEVSGSAFQKVRYSDRVSADALWESGEDPTDGVFVRVNRNHPFYQTIIGPLNAASGERQAFEALIWSAAVAEIKTRENLASITDEHISAVLARFKKVLASNLGTWSAANQDVLDAH
jgi:hypothetical protein